MPHIFLWLCLLMSVPPLHCQKITQSQQTLDISGGGQKVTFYQRELEDAKPGAGFGSELAGVEIRLFYTQPLLGNPQKKPVIDRINEGLGAKTEKDALAFLKKRMQGDYSEWADTPAEDRFNTDLNLSWEFSAASAKFLGFAHTAYNYYGGAHGNTAVEYHVFSLETGARITNANEILNNPQDPKLTALLQKKLLEWAGEDEGDPRGRFFDFDAVRLNDNFMIEPDGLRFLYNQYEIAPYAYGQPEVFFPFAELKPFLKAGGPLGYLLK